MGVTADSVLSRRGGLEVMTWPALSAHPVEVVVTTRHGGVSRGPYAQLNLGLHVGDDPAAVIENRRRAAGAVGAALDDLVFANQVHGREVAVVGRGDRGRGARSTADAIGEVDALVTAEPGVGLVMMAADCTPIVLYDPRAGVLGCVHSGWRGTAGRVADAAIRAMVGLGAEPGRMVAAVGPTVAPAAYQVGPEVVEAVKGALGDVTGVVAPDGTGRWTLDLWAANLRILAAAGVAEVRIHRAVEATGGAEFYSDRRVRPCGRIAAIALMR